MGTRTGANETGAVVVLDSTGASPETEVYAQVRTHLVLREDAEEETAPFTLVFKGPGARSKRIHLSRGATEALHKLLGENL